MKKNERALNRLTRKIEKQFGSEMIMPLDYSGVISKGIDTISTGCLSIDKITGIGGLPRGRIVEIFGPESGGKTTLCLHIISEAQKVGVVAYIDVEHSLDLKYAKNIGVNIDNDKLIFSQPDTGEKALQLVIELLKSKLFSAIVVDSVASLVPEAEFKGDMGDQQMGLQARMMGKAMRKMVHYAKDANTLLVFINQTRKKIGVRFGDPTTTPGGDALKFIASVRLSITRIQRVKGGRNTTVANRTKVVIKKNKCGAPFKTCEFDIIYGKGIDKYSDLISILQVGNILKKGGGKHHLGKHSFKSIDEFYEKIEKNSNVYDKLYKIAKKVEV